MSAMTTPVPSDHTPIKSRIKSIHSGEDIEGLQRGEMFWVFDQIAREAFDAVLLDNRTSLQFARKIPTRTAQGDIRVYSLPKKEYGFYLGNLCITNGVSFDTVTPRDTSYNGLNVLFGESQ